MTTDEMKISEETLADAIYGGTGVRRFSQDSPILPDVWMEYGRKPNDPADLLLNPYLEEPPGRVSRVLKERLDADRTLNGNKDRKNATIAFNQTTVVARLYFDELVRVILPMTRWWNEFVWKQGGQNFKRFMADEAFRDEVARDLCGLPPKESSSKKAAKKTAQKKTASEAPASAEKFDLSPQLLWMVKIIGPIALAKEGKTKLNIEKCIKALERKHRHEEPTDEDKTPKANIVKYAKEIVGALHRLLKNFKQIEISDLQKADEDGGNDTTLSDKEMDERELARKRSLVWSITLNRTASASVWLSTPSVKADAARLLFDVSCAHLGWAVIDSGVDARHPAFFDWERIRQDNASNKAKADAEKDEVKKANADAKKDEIKKVEEEPDAWQKYTRVRETYDFTVIRDILSFDKLSKEEQKSIPPRLKRLAKDPVKIKKLQAGLNLGNNIDWDTLMPFLRIQHDQDYRPPGFEHGTHVAGILAGDWPKDEPANTKDRDIRGVCPDLHLYDLRVLDDLGRGEEFSIIAAMQFIRYLNANKESMVMHGANMSFSIPHNVRNYACGRTPVCDESERMINAGIVVVAAAGNAGYRQAAAGQGGDDSYQSISITDPGNADAVITVGATHRDKAHTYGVSFFSSRGPTGDGRIKPDLVAPGEKIFSATPDKGMKSLDGTSMAAPHVSGAAALLLGRYTELVGRPQRIKEILCKTATDLGRERYFQGHGMLDILRAMQSI
jgi:serine protease AprX